MSILSDERRVKMINPRATCHPWNGPHGQEPTTFTIYPDETVFRSISGDFPTPDEAWNDALKRILAVRP